MLTSILTFIQEVNGIQFAHIKRKELYFVISSLKRNLSPALALELLEAIVSVSKLTMLLFLLTSLTNFTFL